MRITVVSSTDTLASIFRDETKALYAGKQNMRMFHAVAELVINHTFVCEVTDKFLSNCRLSFEEFIGQYHHCFCSASPPVVGTIVKCYYSNYITSLSSLIGEAMYQAASLAIFGLFGPLFPTDSHKDFALLDGNVHILLFQLAFHSLLSPTLAYI